MSILEQMTPIGLDDMKAVRLMNRVDQKYIAPAALLEALLERIAGDYYVQRIPADPQNSKLKIQDSELIAPYRTLYFDTEALDMYIMHHNRKLNRQKLRVRTYRSTDTTFFEIKNKDNKGKTRKVRIPIDVSLFDRALEVPEVQDFVNKNTPYSTQAFKQSSIQAFKHSSTQALKHSSIQAIKQSSNQAILYPTLENRFERITLVDKGMSERITIDHGIRFHNRATQLDADIAHALVIEVKHEVGAPSSAIERALHDLHVLPRRMSKYCIGTALTTPTVKHNRFKPKLLYINKIQENR